MPAATVTLAVSPDSPRIASASSRSDVPLPLPPLTLPLPPKLQIFDTTRAVTKVVQKQVKEQGGVEAVGGPPGNLAARMKADTARLGKLIADAGIQAD